MRYLENNSSDILDKLYPNMRAFPNYDTYSFIGGLYGRIVGNLLVDLHGGIPKNRFWDWIDPGALALVGAASFFGGVSRLTISLTVIMVSGFRIDTILS